MTYLRITKSNDFNYFYYRHVLLQMKVDKTLEPMTLSLFISTFEKLKIKGIGELLSDLANQFKNPDKTINVALMLDKYLDLYPETKLE